MREQRKLYDSEQNKHWQTSPCIEMVDTSERRGPASWNTRQTFHCQLPQAHNYVNSVLIFKPTALIVYHRFKWWKVFFIFHFSLILLFLNRTYTTTILFAFMIDIDLNKTAVKKHENSKHMDETYLWPPHGLRLVLMLNVI